MARELRSIDVSDMPELLRAAEEVEATGEPIALRRNDRVVAVMNPAPKTKRRRKPKTEEQLAAFRSAAGAWKDVDTEALIEYIYEGRRSSKPPVEL